MKKTGVDCPSCDDGHLVERRSKRGKIFYGCDQYPDCDFVVWKRPVARSCPKCDRSYMLERITKRWGHQFVCDNADCKHTEVAEEASQAAGA